MAGFDAATAVEPLDFSFEPYAPGANGTIAEPSDDIVQTFLAVIRDVTQPPATPDGIPQLSLVPEVQTEDDQSADAQLKRARVAMAVVDVCGGAFTAEQYAALPYRLRLAFNGWLAGQFANPTIVRAVRDGGR